jgi:hypothetical protein
MEENIILGEGSCDQATGVYCGWGWGDGKAGCEMRLGWVLLGSVPAAVYADCDGMGREGKEADVLDRKTVHRKERGCGDLFVWFGGPL